MKCKSLVLQSNEELIILLFSYVAIIAHCSFGDSMTSLLCREGKRSKFSIQINGSHIWCCSMKLWNYT